MFTPRPKEQEYAYVPQVDHTVTNQYGKLIETVLEDSELRGQSLNINGDHSVSENPYRYKQHGFYFTADNCIACHACESACSEKNDLPAHLAFRSVGYLEGGAWPSYQRLNISMACNHCDDPVCLKGCPTRAYTKFAEYGAVLQDPDICFGCGYCTWVCPYNAPQLDTKAGHVSKCNMCVDRLEVGLKPACVAACLGGALDFGIVETTPENRHQTKTEIPGFPTADITNPNIRFQQTRSLPREMKRTDSMPIRYERDSEGGGGDYRAKVDKDDREKKWGLKKLSTRENPLVIFTLITQAVVGAFIALVAGPIFGLELINPVSNPIAWPVTLFSLIGVQTVALVLSTLHLGRPHRFYRAFNNLKYSPVSREVAGVAVFYNLLGAYGVLTSLPVLTAWLPAGLVSLLVTITGWGGVLSGLAALYFMNRIYRIKARPFWDHWQVLTSFYGNMLSLGALLAGVISGWVMLASDQSMALIWPVLGVVVLLGLIIEGIGLVFHARDLQKHGGEGEAAYYMQTTDFAYAYLLRNIALVLSAALVLMLVLFPPSATTELVLWSVVASIVLTTALVGRGLFYALVVPTTMPGAFFWKNQGFQEHAREIGLAEMEQAGVLADCH
jgi:DMSO reductase iron-sulfur subunit